VTRLPQRQPGATRSGGPMMPGAPSGPTGGSLFQRLKASENARAAADEAPANEAPANEAPANEAPAPEAPAAEVESHEVEAPAAQVEAPEAETPEPELVSAAPSALQAFADQAAGFTLETPPVKTPAVETPPVGTPPVETPPVETPPVEAPAVEAPAAESWIVAPSSSGFPAGVPAPMTAYDYLDARNPAPPPTGDETPIFRNLKSNWFTAGSADGTWTTSEIEAGWEAAEQVAEAPALQLSDSGLPMRRPGKRLVPGGVTATAANVARDPEAIRARLAAHAAGVSRGRTAAVDESVPAPSTATSTEEGPA
jgi:hypothetical protein